MLEGRARFLCDGERGRAGRAARCCSAAPRSSARRRAGRRRRPCSASAARPTSRTSRTPSALGSAAAEARLPAARAAVGRLLVSPAPPGAASPRSSVVAGRAGSDLPPDRMRSIRASLSASRSRKRQPTIVWPGACAGRSEATRTSPLISSAKNRPWNISRSSIRSTRRVAKATPLLDRSSSEPSTRSPSTMSRQLTATSQATPPIGTRWSARREASTSHLEHAQGDQGQIGRVVGRVVDHHRQLPRRPVLVDHAARHLHAAGDAETRGGGIGPAAVHRFGADADVRAGGDLELRLAGASRSARASSGDRGVMPAISAGRQGSFTSAVNVPIR